MLLISRTLILTVEVELFHLLLTLSLLVEAQAIHLLRLRLAYRPDLYFRLAANRPCI